MKNIPDKKKLQEIHDQLNEKLKKAQPVIKQKPKKESAQSLFEQFPIGKYKNQPIQNVFRDESYCEWLCNQLWFAERYPPLFDAIEHHLILSKHQDELNTKSAMKYASGPKSKIVMNATNEKFALDALYVTRYDDLKASFLVCRN